jgi:hypothetical protein
VTDDAGLSGDLRAKPQMSAAFYPAKHIGHKHVGHKHVGQKYVGQKHVVRKHVLVNKFRATGDLNRWAIRPEIEPQLCQWYDPPLPQPPILQSSGDHCQLAPATCEVASAVLYEPQIESKQTALWESPLATMLRIKQPFPQPTLPSDFIEKPLTDQPIGKH